MKVLFFLFVVLFLHSSKSTPIPLTKIDATETELTAFSDTVAGAITRSNLPRNSIVHLVGSSDVEAHVDWHPLCLKFGVRFLLIGPKLPELPKLSISQPATTTTNTNCVTHFTSLYSQELVSASNLGELTHPDLMIGLNVDIYMLYWRRTLGEMLQLRKPIVVTVYCSYEGHKLSRLMKWKEMEFSKDSLAQCDAFNKMTEQPNLAIPEIVMLWGLEENPHAHAPPKNCYNTAIMEGREHGIRNSFWMGFEGKKRVQSSEQVEEL